jgi:cellulose synthase operon protein C
MDPREIDTLMQRLVANPHDEEALAYAHRAGTNDPRAYAILLEKVGTATADPVYAAHWLSEAANVWSTTIGDAHHAARMLMGALEKDPTQRTAAERLAQLYREKGDLKALVALLERLVKAVTPLLEARPDVRPQLMAMHEELGHLWSEPPFGRPERSLENWRRLADLDAHNVYAIYATRELLKVQQQYAEAIPYFAMEQALITDPERKLALFRDEADTRRLTGDLAGAAQALRNARSYQPDDATLKQELGLAILLRLDANENVLPHEREEAAQLFVSLAEAYDGDYGLSYSVSALKASPGNDRAMQLADFYAGQLGRIAEIGPHFAAYIEVNPNGFMANEARAKASVPSRRGSAPPASGGAGSTKAFGPPPEIASPFGAAPDAAATFGGAPPFGGAPSFGPAPGFGVAPGFGASPATEPGYAGEATYAPSSEQTAGEEEEIDAEEVASERASPEEDLRQVLEEAQAEAQKNRRPQALAKFREALTIDPANTEALAWVEEHLRQKRMYTDLRDVLFAAARVPHATPETRKSQLREVAGLCESQLRDIETAIQAWKQVCQIDRTDDQAREQLRRLLERGARWDDLALLLEQEAMSAPEVEQKITLEKKVATLHEQRRKDPGSAAEAFARIAALSPGDESPVLSAVKLFERAERLDAACQVVTDNLAAITDVPAHAALLQKLGELRGKVGDPGGSGEAYAEAAESLGQAKAWELAEKAFLAAERFADAAAAVERRAQLVDGKPRASLLAQAAEMLERAGDTSAAIDKLEQATAIDPANDGSCAMLEGHYQSAGRDADLVRFLLDRACKLPDKARRTAARRRAAELQDTLGDQAGARESRMLLLADGEDEIALGKLVDDAVERAEFQEAVGLLRRLGAITKELEGKVMIALREAAIFAENLGDTDAAIERYEAICKSLDPKSRIALHATFELEEKRGNLKGAAAALEREIPLAEGEERVELAAHLARIYEGELADPHGAIRALDIVHEADPEDFDAVARLLRLSEAVGDFARVSALTQTLIEVEGDEEEASRLTLRFAEVLHEKLGKGDEALSALERLADEGDEPCRRAYVALGDTLGFQGLVASKLVAWSEGSAVLQRNDALRGAFSRFVSVGRDQDAARVGLELARARGADRSIAEGIEQIALRLRDREALGIAHEILHRELSGSARSAELVRQAEVQVSVGGDPLEAMHYGEAGLASVPAGEVEPLLARLATLSPAPMQVIDLYERQVSRCRAPEARLAALARAAQVAAERGAEPRARKFFELALGGGIQEETIAALEGAARRGDERVGGTTLLRILAEALAAGGQGSRDGGRTRGALLRRAAGIAARDVGDVECAFSWLGDALITHVDDASLDALEQLGVRASALGRVEATLTRVLEEVFDGPLVRRLVQRRARLRRDALGDKVGAAADLKKLHDLSPADHDVMGELSALLRELGDHRGMIQLYEDQILRSRDPAARAELARKVAHLWEEELGDAREAADAWRRVLRMKAGDAEATAGLERAKLGNLRRAEPQPATAEESLGSVEASPVYDLDGTRDNLPPSFPSHEIAVPASTQSPPSIEPPTDRALSPSYLHEASAPAAASDPAYASEEGAPDGYVQPTYASEHTEPSYAPPAYAPRGYAPPTYASEHAAPTYAPAHAPPGYVAPRPAPPLYPTDGAEEVSSLEEVDEVDDAEIIDEESSEQRGS